MKLFALKVFNILTHLLLMATAIWLGLFREIVQPFVALPERIRLFSYMNYALLLSTPVLALGVIIISSYQLFHPKRDIYSYGKWGNVMVTSILIVGVIAFFNRAYLGYRVDQAGYVECKRELHVSSRSSWRVYATHKGLCKSSSGIAGG